MTNRIGHAGLAGRRMSAEDAAGLIQPGMTVGMSGFTGAGYPKLVPPALAKRIAAAHERGDEFGVRVLTGASTAPELDGELARAGGVAFRMPYQSDPDMRKCINGGESEYMDVHLSHVAPQVYAGNYGKMDMAVIEVTAILPDGGMVPSTAVGTNEAWLDVADKVIIEVNANQPMDLEGMHDIYFTSRPPPRDPIPLRHTGDRIGEPYLRCDLSKVVAVVECDLPDRMSSFTPADETSKRIAGHLIDFLHHEVKMGRLPENLLPIQSGVGNIANAVLAGLKEGGFSNLTAFTEVLQDGLLELVGGGTVTVASATALSLSPEGVKEFLDNIMLYRDKIILRPQAVSNHPELIRRLGCIAMNGLVEADIYGNVNSTHVAGSSVINGIGGSGDFTRNAYLSCFVTPSTAKNGDISCIVPMVSHVDHTEHDVSVVVTDQGLADLRGLSPKQRARAVISNCAHPSYRPMLEDYFDRACRTSKGKHTPHLLAEATSWHQRFLDTGSMKS
ncbi:MAG: acetyl-CoA hydrolase/transferase family protein [Xanthomonadaceae bacterium]|nr:acetyl-CoA hydrolase/transferase family protein [Xanthomonadaceae bacterium]